MSKIVEIDCCADCQYMDSFEGKYNCRRLEEPITFAQSNMYVLDDCPLPNAERIEK
jgi:hypothetical protein